MPRYPAYWVVRRYLTTHGDRSGVDKRHAAAVRGLSGTHPSFNRGRDERFGLIVGRTGIVAGLDVIGCLCGIVRWENGLFSLVVVGFVWV